MTNAEPACLGHRRHLLEAVYEDMGDKVYGFVLVRCGDAALAADVTSDVFVSAARAIRGDNPDQVTPSWLLTTARRRLIDHWRSDASRRRLTERIHVEAMVASRSAEPDLERIAAALDRLKPRERAAITLRYLDGLCVEDVAEALGTSYRAAESLLARSRRKFRTAWRTT